MEAVERRRKAAVHRRGEASESAAHEGAPRLQVPTAAQAKAEHGKQNGRLFVPDALLDGRHERAPRRRTGPALLAVGGAGRRSGLVGAVRLHDDQQQQHELEPAVGDLLARLGQEPPVRFRLAVRHSAAPVLRHAVAAVAAVDARHDRTVAAQFGRRKHERAENVAGQRARKPHGRVRQRIAVAHCDTDVERRLHPHPVEPAATSTVAGRSLLLVHVQQGNRGGRCRKLPPGRRSRRRRRNAVPRSGRIPVARPVGRSPEARSRSLLDHLTKSPLYTIVYYYYYCLSSSDYV